MKKFMRSMLCVLPFAMALSGCNALQHQPKPTEPVIAIKDTFPALPPAQNILRLKEGQTAQSADKSVAVTFDKVISDDRCPVDSKCIWAGNATVALTVTNAAKQSQTLQLSSGDLRGDLKRKATVLGQEISLETVYPTPSSTTDKQDLTGYYLVDVKAVPASK